MEEEIKTLTPEEETEAIKALKETYETQLQELRETIKTKDAEHAKQIKEILQSGTQNNAPVESEPEEEDTEEAMCNRILSNIRKKRGN
jgi:CHASE3 domain sensor protein